jgi:NAD(P)-dependent dehydrogenase (short-subunit alcohol dehydrogenase family)
MAHANAWNVDRLPQQEGKVFVVTGATGGIGYFIAEQLAMAGAHVILAVRSEDKAKLAVRAVRARVPGARLTTVRLDLGDLDSVRSAAGLLSQGPRLDGVVLNAGVLARDARSETADGHELVYGTNHLGHFALVALIYPALERTDGSRIVTMGSVAARSATLNLDDLESSRQPYRAFDAYKESKLAQMIFAFELNRRLRRAASRVSSLVAHPGGALDGLTPSRPPVFARTGPSFVRALPLAAFAQGKDHAAWPAVRALLDPSAKGGQLWGPRFLRWKGAPVLEQPTPAMADLETAGQLWALSEKATDITWSPHTDRLSLGD